MWMTKASPSAGCTESIPSHESGAPNRILLTLIGYTSCSPTLPPSTTGGNAEDSTRLFYGLIAERQATRIIWLSASSAATASVMASCCARCLSCNTFTIWIRSALPCHHLVTTLCSSRMIRTPALPSSNEDSMCLCPPMIHCSLHSQRSLSSRNTQLQRRSTNSAQLTCANSPNIQLTKVDLNSP